VNGDPIGNCALYRLAGSTQDNAADLTRYRTNNPELLNDPLYIGWRNERIRGSEYDEFIDKFGKSGKKRFPNVLLQWEDFAKTTQPHSSSVTASTLHL